MTKETIKQGVRFLSKKHGISFSDIEYIGSTDCSFIWIGAQLLQYNIIKIGHDLFGSTVAYKYGWEA